MDIQKEIDCLPNEEWRYIESLENVYAISNKGRLASRKRNKWNILSNRNSKNGYFSVTLRNGNTTIHSRIHRLVYEAFVGKIPHGRKHHIHHINHNKQDNRLENLLLVSAKEHYQLDIDSRNTSGLRPIWENHVYACRPKRIVQKALDGTIIAYYNCAKDAHLATGVCERNIRQVASKEPYNDKGCTRKQAGGFIWEDVEEL